jgi:hypothetical protein
MGRSPSVATLQEKETQVNHVEDGNQCGAGRKEEDRKLLLWIGAFRAVTSCGLVNSRRIETSAAIYHLTKSKTTREIGISMV